MKEPTPVSKLHHGPRHHGHAHAAHHGAAFQKMVGTVRQAHAAAPVAPAVGEALRTAMAREGVPASWEHPLLFIMGRESSGQVGASNSRDSARGLFQLTEASYHHNPNGASSFGNAVEEAQGGIRYIQSRYRSADHAMKFWQAHGWY